MEKHQHIRIRHGYATLTGSGEPSKELLDALNVMADLAYEQCVTLKVNVDSPQPAAAVPEKKEEIYIANGVRYKKVRNLFFHYDVPEKLCDIINRLYLSGERIIIEYGDTRNHREWTESLRERGSIGRSTGEIKVPLLIATKRSKGGNAISDLDIMYIKNAKTKKLLYNYKINGHGNLH